MRGLTVTLVAAGLALLLSVTAGASTTRVRGTVVARNAVEHTVTVDARRAVRHVLFVRGSLARIRLGQSVELRGSTLRLHRHGSGVLARGVKLLRTQRRVARPDRIDDDEVEVRGVIRSLSPLTVAGVTCDVPAGFSLAGFAVGELVELTCDRIRGRWIVRKLQSEEDDNREERDKDEDDDDHSGSGRRGGDDDGDGGPGRG
jgi:hypothetical protein